MAAIVILDADKTISGLTDSKKLTDKKRRDFACLIKKQAKAWGIARAEASEIDRLNILQATLLAMARAFSQLQMEPDWVMVDGTFYPDISSPGEAIVQGDSKIDEISAASILAKVARDDEMKSLDILYSGFGFTRHKGYPTKFHLEKIQQLGITELHRKSFSPVKRTLIEYL